MSLAINDWVLILLKLSLFVALICSLYFCVLFILYQKKKYFISWQFPMILAIFFDLYLLEM